MYITNVSVLLPGVNSPMVTDTIELGISLLYAHD